MENNQKPEWKRSQKNTTNWVESPKTPPTTWSKSTKPPTVWRPIKQGSFKKNNEVISEMIDTNKLEKGSHD